MIPVMLQFSVDHIPGLRRSRSMRIIAIKKLLEIRYF